MSIRAKFSSPERRRAAIAERWPALSDEDIRLAENDREHLIVRIVERYGISKEWAECHVADWEAKNGAD